MCFVNFDSEKCDFFFISSTFKYLTCDGGEKYDCWIQSYTLLIRGGDVQHCSSWMQSPPSSGFQTESSESNCETDRKLQLRSSRPKSSVYYHVYFVMLFPSRLDIAIAQ